MNHRVGFVSLGCPKALVDSERIITQLRAQGYELVSTYDNAGVVVINTCGFIDSAVKESMDAIREAMAENGRVIVTGCLGAKADLIREACPDVLHISGPHAYEEVVRAVHRHLPHRLILSHSSCHHKALNSRHVITLILKFLKAVIINVRFVLFQACVANCKAIPCKMFYKTRFDSKKRVYVNYS